MVSLSMTKNEGITVNVPAASTSAPKEKSDAPLTLSVAQQGEIFVNKEKINFAQLPIRIQNAKAATKDLAVVVNADGKAEYSHVVAVIDEVKKAGVTKVALSTERK
jgi:biopolymer transport protein ExbD